MSSRNRFDHSLRGNPQPASNDSGQSLIETALMLPLLLTVVFNAVNIGYFFLVALNLSVSPRIGAQYSIQGGQSSNQLMVPSAASVRDLVLEDIGGSLAGAGATPVRVCSKIIGVSGSGTSQVAQCTIYNGGTFTGPDPDPEAPYFVLHRVDVKYTITPLIQGAAFKIMLPSSLTFHRQVSMRAMD